MLKKLLSQKIRVGISHYSYTILPKGSRNNLLIEGIVTDIDDNFIELDNQTIVAIRAITYIQTIS